MKKQTEEITSEQRRDKRIQTALIGFGLLSLLLIYAIMAPDYAGQPNSNPIDFLKKNSASKDDEAMVKNASYLVLRGKDNRRIFDRSEQVVLDIIVDSDDQSIASLDVPITYPTGVTYESSENLMKEFKILDSIDEENQQVFLGIVPQSSLENEYVLRNKQVASLAFKIPDGVKTLYPFSVSFKGVKDTTDANILVKQDDKVVDILQSVQSVDVLIGNTVELEAGSPATLEDSTVTLELLKLAEKNCTEDGCDQYIQLLVDGKTTIEETYTKGTIEYKEFEVLTKSGQRLILNVSPQDLNGEKLTVYYYQGAK